MEQPETTLALQEAGCFYVILECVLASVAFVNNPSNSYNLNWGWTPFAVNINSPVPGTLSITLSSQVDVNDTNISMKHELFMFFSVTILDTDIMLPQKNMKI